MHHYFCRLFNYDKWAGSILLDIFEQKPATNPRVNELLSHILSAQRIWLDRCLRAAATAERFQARTPAMIKTDMELYHDEWTAYIKSIQPEDFSKIIPYTNLQGGQLTNTLSDIITQVINHGTHHRGTIIALMKTEGFSLPMLDYIRFTRQTND
jgi:uncharacterized damage-inducible protein DinB